MRIRFAKMQGCGNDFVVIDTTDRPFHPDRDAARRLADRHFGIGCDQVLLLARSARPGVDLEYRIFNADGSEVAQCGNGLRCVARYAYERGLVTGPRMTVASAAGLAHPTLHEDGTVTVQMAVPRFAPEEIPFIAEGEAVAYDLALAGTGSTVRLSVCALGNPHAVLRVDDVDQAPVATLGPQIAGHERFPQGVNVGFLQVEARDALRLRVFERGAGETLACGTGACAAQVTAHRLGLTDARAQVVLPGGTLTVSWPGQGQPVTMRGPAQWVFEGEIEL